MTIFVEYQATEITPSSAIAANRVNSPQH